MSLVLVSVRMRFPAVALLALTMLLMLCAAPSQSEASHGWGNVHWRNTGTWPMTVTLYNSLSDSAPAGALGDARSSWNGAQGRITWATTSAANGADTRQPCSDPSGARNLRVCDYNWGATGWAGRATWDFCDYGGTSHVCAGGIKVNRQYGTSYAFYRQVLCHEIGHYMGLDDRTSGSGCMRTAVPPETQYQTPSAHDVEQGVAQHDHRHAASTLTSLQKDFVGGKVIVNFSGSALQNAVYRSVNGGSYQHLTTTGANNHWDRPGATLVGATLCYRVRGLEEGGLSPWSNGRCVVWSPDNASTPVAPPPPYDNGDDVTPDGPPDI
jgi:hypothetical protein